VLRLGVEGGLGREVCKQRREKRNTGEKKREGEERREAKRWRDK